jgi:hypothetical protein
MSGIKRTGIRNTRSSDLENRIKGVEASGLLLRLKILLEYRSATYESAKGIRLFQ